MRALAYSLLRDGKITTTEAKAKAMRPAVERLITVAKKKTPGARRLLLRRLPNEKMVHHLVSRLAPKHAERKGGYVRIIHSGRRRSDGAKMAIIELV